MDGFSLFLRRAFIKGMGYSDDALSRPIVGIVGHVERLQRLPRQTCRSWWRRPSAASCWPGGCRWRSRPCRCTRASRNPTSMFLRNLAAMDTEEMCRAQPMDSVLMIGGCDKTVPAQLMAAASLDIPVVQLVTGPMLVGPLQGRRYWAPARIAVASGPGTRAGEFTEAEMGRHQRPPGAHARHLHGDGHRQHHGLQSRRRWAWRCCPAPPRSPRPHADRIRCAEQSGAAAVGRHRPAGAGCRRTS